MKKKVIIFGAGPAGLTIGYELLKNYNDLDVVILEKTDAVGGISKTKEFCGNRFDLGGHRYFSKNDKVLSWWKEFLEIDRQPKHPNKECMLIKNRKSSILYNGKYIDYPVTFNKQTLSALGLKTSLEVVISYIYSKITNSKIETLADFYRENFGESLYKIFFKDYTKKLWGKDAEGISSDWGKQRVQKFSIIDVIKGFISNKHLRNNRTTQPCFYYPMRGSGQLWEKVAKEFCNMGGKIVFKSNVCRLSCDNHLVESVECEDGEKIHGDLFISSIPLRNLLNGINDVPNDISRISQNLPYRDFIIVALKISKSDIMQGVLQNNNNTIDDNWIYIQDKNLEMSRIQIFDNWSEELNPDKDSMLLGVEFFCQENDAFWKLSNEELKNVAFENLCKASIINGNTEVTKYSVERVEKAYPAYWDGYYDIDKVIDYINEFDNLFCIGRNGQHSYNNIDHSMETAFVLLEYLMGKITNKKELWRINKQEEYCEGK